MSSNEINILTINAGLSSIKFKIFRYLYKNKINLLLQGCVMHINVNPAVLEIKDPGSKIVDKYELYLDQDNRYLSAISQLCLNDKFNRHTIDCVINRVLYGDEEYDKIILLHHKTFINLSRYNDLAPLQQPINLLLAAHFMEMYPKIKHYACFDTGFHRSIPLINQVYALPWKYTTDGIKRVGLYGISYTYIAQHLESLFENKIAKGKWLIAHLGSSSSICGIKQGKSLVCSVGMSAIDGIPMASAVGELDPAIPLYLKSNYQLTMEEMNDILYKESGLLGLSNGLSGDIRVLLNSKEKQARFAVEFYVLQVASYLTKIATQLGGINGIIFTGGIGENVPEIRSLILDKLEWIGVSINRKANNRNKLKICKKDSLIKVLVVPTNEELAMVNLLIEHKL